MKIVLAIAVATIAYFVLITLTGTLVSAPFDQIIEAMRAASQSNNT